MLLILFLYCYHLILGYTVCVVRSRAQGVTLTDGAFDDLGLEPKHQIIVINLFSGPVSYKRDPSSLAHSQVSLTHKITC